MATMRVFVIAAGLLIAPLGAGTRGVSQNGARPHATDSGRDISKDNAGSKEQNERKIVQIPPCTQCVNCSYPEQPPRKNKEEQAKQDSLDRLYRRYMWATIWGVLGAWFGLVALIIQTITSRQSSQRQLRAYVLGENGSIVNIANPVLAFPGQIIEPTGAEITNLACGPIARIQIRNTGQTPAFEVKHWGNICFREHPLTAGLPPRPAGAFPMSSSVLGPGIISTKLFILPALLTAQQISDLRAGTGAVYVYGEVTYRDAFKAERLTKYRLMYHIMGGAIGVSTELTFAAEGNEAT